MQSINSYKKKNDKFYDNYFGNFDFDVYRNDVGSYCTRKIIINQIKQKTGKILEIGTGVSSLLFDLQNFTCFGIDISESTINFTKKLFEKENKKAYFIVADGEELPFKSNTFNVIVSSHTFEHIKNDEKVLKECARILAPNGELIIFVPGRKNGIATKQEFDKFGHYRYYNLKRFKYLEKNIYPLLKIKSIYYPHKIHNLIWNRFKKIFRWVNYPIKKWILRDNKTYEKRIFYQKIILPCLAKMLDTLDKLFMHSEKNFLSIEFNVLVRFTKNKK
ncbi:methyltransferase domain-containing protein [Candidatus Dependentiae bacterium]|nr:methyltransferase domain-containing protein [Candidatus Dependentiae bacterium]